MARIDGSVREGDIYMPVHPKAVLEQRDMVSVKDNPLGSAYTTSGPHPLSGEPPYHQEIRQHASVELCVSRTRVCCLV